MEHGVSARRPTEKHRERVAVLAELAERWLADPDARDGRGQRGEPGEPRVAPAPAGRAGAAEPCLGLGLGYGRLRRYHPQVITQEVEPGKQWLRRQKAQDLREEAPAPWFGSLHLPALVAFFD